MTTVLFYLVIAAVIGIVVFFLAVLVFGRGEQMAPLDPRTSPAELPETDVTSEDVRRIRFALAVRGYRMSDVDWTLERLGEQLDVLRRENTELRAETGRGPVTGLRSDAGLDADAGPSSDAGRSAATQPSADPGPSAAAQPSVDPGLRPPAGRPDRDGDLVTAGGRHEAPGRNANASETDHGGEPE